MKIPLAELIGSIVYVVCVPITAKVLTDLNASFLSISLSTVICLLSVNFFLTIYYFKTSKKLIHFKIDLKKISKFLFSTLIMSVTIFLMHPESAKSEQILIVLLSLMPVILIGALVYFLTLSIIDIGFRRLVKSLVKNIKLF